MKYRNNPDAPSAEMLAAYADGELEMADRLDVEAWLANHPQASARIECQERLAQLLQATHPDEPAESTWDAVLAGIQEGLRGTRSPGWNGPGSAPISRAGRLAWKRTAIRLLSAAAAIVLLTSLDRVPPRGPAAVTILEPWPVTSSEEIDIISMHAGDTGLLVVGDPPVREPLALAAAGDVFVESVRPDVDGMVPYVLLEEVNRGAPMIVAPLGSGANRVDYRP
jgi:hypothetical protein